MGYSGARTVNGSSDTLLQYPMTLRKGTKDPYLPRLVKSIYYLLRVKRENLIIKRTQAKAFSIYKELNGEPKYLK